MVLRKCTIVRYKNELNWQIVVVAHRLIYGNLKNRFQDAEVNPSMMQGKLILVQGSS
jgi:hypothetical protein